MCSELQVRCIKYYVVCIMIVAVSTVKLTIKIFKYLNQKVKHKLLQSNKNFFTEAVNTAIVFFYLIPTT